MKIPFSQFGKKNKHLPEIDATLMGEHFDSIRHELTEVRTFKKKKSLLNPTHVHWKSVDIEAAWPVCRESVEIVYGELVTISAFIEIETEGLNPEAGLAVALDQTLRLLNQVMLGMADALGTGRVSEEELQTINEHILRIQTLSSQVRRFVMTEFEYPESRPSPRPPRKSSK